MDDRNFIIESCLMDAEKGYLVDESVMSWLKGKAAGAKQLGKNIGTSIGNAGKNAKAGYKNALGKLAGGETHRAAKKEASDIKASRGEKKSASEYANRVDKAVQWKEQKAAGRKQREKDSQKLRKLAQKAYTAVQDYVDAGGKLSHGRTSSVKTTLNSLKAAAGIADEQEPAKAENAAPAAEKAPKAPQKSKKPGTFTADDLKGHSNNKVQKNTNFNKPSLKKKEAPKKKTDVTLSPVDGVNSHSAEWEETVNRSVTAIGESFKHKNTLAQMRMINSIK